MNDMTRRNERRARDAKQMSDPLLWPYWPWLPIKRHIAADSAPQCAVMHADETGQNNRSVPIYTTYMFTIKSFFPTSDMPRTTYASLDELQNDGWVVD
jgi:hypothetical protein